MPPPPANKTAESGETPDWIAKRQDMTFDSSPYSTRHVSGTVREQKKSKAADNLNPQEIERCEALRRIRFNWASGLFLELEDMLEPAYFGAEIPKAVYMGFGQAVGAHGWEGGGG